MTDECDHNWECVHCGEQMLPCDYPETHNVADLRRRERLEIATAMRAAMIRKYGTFDNPVPNTRWAFEIADAMLAEAVKEAI